jgi:hypothetical protein
MPQPVIEQEPLRRAIADLVVAEMLLLHATVESLSVIGRGAQQLGRHLVADSSDPDQPVGSIASLLQTTASRALEPYSTRLTYLRQMQDL